MRYSRPKGVLVSGFRLVQGLLVPARYPERVGIGCPQHDDHETISFSEFAGNAEKHPTIEAFLKRHPTCSPLQTLEEHGGKLEVTGELRDRSS